QPDIDDIIEIQFSVQYNLAEGDTLFVTSLNGRLDTAFTNNTHTFFVDVTDTKITVRLKTTNTSISSGGFSANYAATYETYCRGGINSHSSKQGTFDYGSGNNRYNNFADCRYRIIVDGVKSITIHFNKFETEKDKDILYIYNNTGGNPLLMALSGTHTDSTYTFNTNRLFFIFETDEKNIDQGWELSYDTDVLTIEELEENKIINIFPNPSQDKIQIISEKTDMKTIDILNVTGQLIYSEKSEGKRHVEINMYSFSSGIYFVRVTNTANEVFIKKIILNKS
ncbi:MAG: T9SS type A sorting domain-containing protein, partial [Bacteroidales bacterium]|nr:T9SS type A sorting domain-containing protein [Bacteroidales bacterium]